MKVGVIMDGPKDENTSASKHCLVEDIKICTRCGSSNIVIEGKSVTCNDCNAILCYEHRDG